MAAVLKIMQRHQAQAFIKNTLKSGDNQQTPIDNLSIQYVDQMAERHSSVQQAGVLLVLSGSVQIRFGKALYQFDEMDLGIYTVPCATQGRVLSHPFMSMVLSLDMMMLSQLYQKLSLANDCQSCSQIDVYQSDEHLQGAFFRLLGLLQTPNDIPHLAPLIEQEIYYRLLNHPKSHALRQMLSQGSAISRISTASRWIEEHYHQAFKVTELAEQVGMSESSFYQHFKQSTGLTPIQYQRILRLTKARQLLMTDKHPVQYIAHTVGYASPSQFSKDYRAYFGISPKKESLAVD